MAEEYRLNEEDLNQLKQLSNIQKGALMIFERDMKNIILTLAQKYNVPFKEFNIDLNGLFQELKPAEVTITPANQG